jgi:hypothetical protein
MSTDPVTGVDASLFLLNAGATRDALSSPLTSFGIPITPDSGFDSAPKVSPIGIKICDGNPNPWQSAPSRSDVSGTFRVPLGWAWIPHILTNWLGLATITGLSDPYTYDGAYGTGMPVGFHLERKQVGLTNLYRLIRGCRPTSFGITMDIDGHVYFDLGYQGASVDDWSASSQIGTPTVYDGGPVVHQIGTVEIDTVAVGYIKTLQVTLTHSTQTDGYSCGQSGDRNVMAMGQGEIAGSMEVWLNDDTAPLILGSVASTQTAYQLELLFDESGTRYLWFDFPKVNLYQRGEAINTDQGLVATFDFQAYRDSAAGVALNYDMQSPTPG